MKFAMCCAALLSALVLLSATAAAQQKGEQQFWKLFKLNRINGITCEEDKSLEPPDNPKCASLPADGSTVTVTDFTLTFRPLHGGLPQTVRVDFCGKFEDNGANGAKCQVMIDGALADPGETTMNVEDMGAIPVTDYTACMSWFGNTEGNPSADLEIQCKNDGKGDKTSTVDLSSFTSSFLSQ